MDDSDEFEFDDFVLDEQTVAALDQAEQNYQKPPPKPSSPAKPANKRHKTKGGWRAGIGSYFTDNNDFDDLPEISVRGDGIYSIRSSTPNQNAQSRQKDMHAASTAHPIGASSSTYRPNRSILPISPSRTKPIVLSQETAKKSSILAASQQASQQAKLEAQLKELQKRVEELRDDNTKVQSSLQKAVEARITKEGEVSILRKNIEKSSQDHAAQIAQLKAEKEQADSKRLQMQIEMEKELEALRTDYKFKEQELAVSVRKPPASMRGKKFVVDVPATPLARVGRGGYTVDFSEASGSRTVFDATPIRPPPPPIFKMSPSKSGRRSPTKKKLVLPGFENAFESATPKRSPSKRKGKAKAMDFDLNENPFALPFPSVPFMQPSQVAQDTLTEEVSALNVDATMDEEMSIVSQEVENLPEPEQQLDWINWKAELCRIILTHSHSSGNEITFQRILGSLGVIEDVDTYSASCARILTVLSTSSRSDDYESSLESVCLSLGSILVSLHHAKQHEPLFTLFDLLTELILSIPPFLKALLTARPLDKGGGPEIISILQNVILEQLLPDKMTSHTDLACSVLSLLESICFQPSPSSTEQLHIFFQNHDVLIQLVQSPHPNWFLERSFRLLAVVSSHHDIWGSLLGPSLDGQSNHFLIDRLSSHLVDTNKLTTEISKSHILIFLTQMSIAHPGAHATLTESSTLIPSVIIFMSHLTNPLWEDDERLLSSKEALSMLVQTIDQTICFLYRLVFATDPCVNLRSRIQQAPVRPFSILLPTFTVSFGRLSYADPPVWVDAENRRKLESIAEIARDLLELVIDGPEGDSVWATFQPEQDEDSTADMEDLEARLIGNEA